MSLLKEYIAQAKAKKIALGHFNISTVDALWAAVNAASKLSVPVIIGVSEGERDFIGIKAVRALVSSIKESTGIPIFLNADHTYSFDRVKEVVEAGFDSVIFDGSELSFEENCRQTRACVDYVKSVNPTMLVEGELGYIGKSSKLLDAIPDTVSLSGDSLTQPDQAQDFVSQTGVDLLAPAVGNLHGMLKNAPNPRLDIELVGRLAQASNAPLVLHGGSGISVADFKASIAAGITIVHINTELRKAWREALQTYLEENPDEVSPYKIMTRSQTAVQTVIEEKLALFNAN